MSTERSTVTAASFAAALGSLTPFPFRAELINLGMRSYAAVREQQERLMEAVQHGCSGPVILLCEHPPTLTLGKNNQTWDSTLSLADWQQRGVEVVQTDRGGRLALHLPGQLMIYPIVSLRQLQIGVRAFAEEFLCWLQEGLSRFDVEVEVSTDSNTAGIWTGGFAQKIGFVGLRITHGVSGHGFAVNVDCDLHPFQLFSPCGTNGSKISSLSRLVYENNK